MRRNSAVTNIQPSQQQARALERKKQNRARRDKLRQQAAERAGVSVATYLSQEAEAKREQVLFRKSLQAAAIEAARNNRQERWYGFW